MQNTVTLNGLYAEYTAGLLKKRDLEASVFRIMQEDICRGIPPGWNRDDYNDFVSWFYFRLDRAISSYREKGSSFENYIGTMIRMAAREYRTRQYRNDIAEAAAWIVQIPDMHVCEEAPEYNEPRPLIREEPSKLPEILKTPRQLLILILKCCNYISDNFLEKIMPILEVEPEVLSKMIRILKTQRENREEEAKTLRERVNCQFHRCILYEKNLMTAAEGSNAERRYKIRLERGRKRLNKMRRQLARIRLDPSNCQIAELLGLSKGTVDSILYSVKSRWNISENKNILN
jgi:RNA polymerase sigma factor (sigma-70 family)